jgi:ABC-type antimicrobial peptide transport system permease subunit
MALGAEHSQVLGKVLRRGLFMGVLGIVLGTFLAIGLGRVIESQLFGIRPWDPKTLGAVAVLLLGATLVASYLPARRAAGTDPVQVLKGE